MPTFLTLPPEVRLHIYEDVLVLPHEIRPIYDEAWEWGALILDTAVPAIDLLLTSRQIFNEARPILYSKNAFHLAGRIEDPNHEAIISFIKSTGSENMSFIRILTIDFAWAAVYITEEEGTVAILNILEELGSPLEASVRRGIKDIEDQYETSICDALRLMARNCRQLRDLTLEFPSRGGVGIAGIFGQDFFSTRSQIRNVMKTFRGVERLTITHTADFKAAEEVARAISVKYVTVAWQTPDQMAYTQDVWNELVSKHQRAGWVSKGHKRSGLAF